jgi:hypothetical protein
VRRLVLGAALEQEIAPEVKENRLPATTREALVRLIDEARAARFPSLPKQFSENILTAYVNAFRDEMLRALREFRARLSAQRTALLGPFDAQAQAISALAALDQDAAKVAVDLEALAQQENAEPLAHQPAIPPALAETETVEGAVLVESHTA